VAPAFVRLFRGRHTTIDDHALGKPDGGLHVPVLPDDVLDMGQALAGGVLDAPALPRSRPLDFRPHHPIDHEVEGLGVDVLNLDHAEASAVCCHCGFSICFIALPPSPLSARNIVTNPITTLVSGISCP
jgi:hypothetical protein